MHRPPTNRWSLRVSYTDCWANSWRYDYQPQIIKSYGIIMYQLTIVIHVVIIGGHVYLLLINN